LPDAGLEKKVVEKRWFYGKKLHLISAPNGTMIRFRLTRGSPHDSRAFSSLNSKNFKRLTADSAYRAVGIRQDQKIAITKPFSQQKRQRQLNGKRVGIERVFNTLKRLNLEKGIVVKNARSLGSHILAVLTCLLAVQYVNLIEGFKPLAIHRFLC
jgi:transposase